MTESKEIFLDKNLRCGGFYELAIQVCPSIDNVPIKLYTDFIWTLNNVSGPFDEDYKTIRTDIENIQHRGLIRLDDFVIPFMTYNIRETEPIETGFNWFDICFHTAAIEHVFGSEYQTWTENLKVPKQLTDFFNSTLKDLYKLFPFELGILDFEVSGQYYLDDLKKPLTNTWTNSNFYLGRENFDLIAPENRKIVKQIEEIN
ncbi:hypothetical protein AWE51_25470 [Aquimarina aggregata]|uniref:Uncharacterized protein n=1 Tax=Aquimarina aggregata TaxID=1642818 RepID=A0A162ZWP9_9FLAO|nr:hypothetical protein [Aquimarina aggregata]KZS40089.1 hypothetical protein AWE51_25470 [Aquimarina aggregata]